MIKIKVLETKFEHILKPTIFPDKTSQVWQLPEELINCGDVSVTWNFEEEREIIDLISLSNLVNIFIIIIIYIYISFIFHLSPSIFLLSYFSFQFS